MRLLGAGRPALPAARAVADVGFKAAGTAVGPEGPAERDAAIKPAMDFLRERLRDRLTVTAVAETADGPVGVGSHQPVGDVTEVVGVATLPCARRQGLGGAVTGALVADALAHGAEIVFLSAGSEEIARVYGRLGFRRIGTALHRRMIERAVVTGAAVGIGRGAGRPAGGRGPARLARGPPGRPAGRRDRRRAAGAR